MKIQLVLCKMENGGLDGQTMFLARSHKARPWKRPAKI